MSKKDLKLKGKTIPPVLESFIESGGTSVSTDDDDWEIRFESPSSAVVKKGVPANALIFAENGYGDFMYLLVNPASDSTFDDTVYVYWHEEGRSEVLAGKLNGLLYPPEPTPSKQKTIYYYGGKIEVKLGDEVSARDLFFRRTGRVVYLPGVSKKNREFEYGGLTEVGIRFSHGSMTATVVDPNTSWLKKSVRFIGRSDSTFEEIKPNERFE